MVTGRLDGRQAGRMEQCSLNCSTQDEAELTLIWLLASLLVAGRMISFIF